MTSEVKEFTIREDAGSGERLDLFLAKQLDGVSRSGVQKLIIAGQVTVDGQEERSNYKLVPGDVVVITIPPAQPLELAAEAIPLDVLYEDEDVIVINKARGMVVHPAVGNYSGTLVNALLEHCDDLSGINGVIRPGIVHRLDKETSGVMVVAKNDRSHVNLAEQIKARTASRRYVALVYGNIKEEQGVINAPIGRHPVNRKKMAVTFTGSKEAITHFTVTERFGEYTLVECKLQTGRTHQIRVHMTYIGHPLVGDMKYGPQKNPFPIRGQALHSRELTFEHPVRGGRLEFTAPLPEDLEDILRILRQKNRQE